MRGRCTPCTSLTRCLPAFVPGAPRRGPSLPLFGLLLPERSRRVIPVHVGVYVPCSRLTASAPQASTSPSVLTGIPCVWDPFSWSRVSFCFCTSVNMDLCVSERSPFGNQENVRWRKSVTHWRQTSDRVDKWVWAGSSLLGLDQCPENWCPPPPRPGQPREGKDLSRGVKSGPERPPQSLLSPPGPRMKWNTRPWWTGTWQPRQAWWFWIHWRSSCR